MAAARSTIIRQASGKPTWWTTVTPPLFQTSRVVTAWRGDLAAIQDNSRPLIYHLTDRPAATSQTIWPRIWSAYDPSSVYAAPSPAVVSVSASSSTISQPCDAAKRTGGLEVGHLPVTDLGVSARSSRVSVPPILHRLS